MGGRPASRRGRGCGRRGWPTCAEHFAAVGEFVDGVLEVLVGRVVAGLGAHDGDADVGGFFPVGYEPFGVFAVEEDEPGEVAFVGGFGEDVGVEGGADAVGGQGGRGPPVRGVVGLLPVDERLVLGSAPVRNLTLE
jgi:hypothetical protein